MKTIKTSLLALVLLATGVSQAQNKNNPWAVSFGVNAVDVRTEGDYSGFDVRGFLKDGFGNFKDVGILPAISKLSVARYLGNGFSAEIDGTLNKLEEGFGDTKIDETFWAVNLQGRYALRNIFTTENGWFDPYVKAGAGFSSVIKQDVKALAGLGINFWLNDNIGLNVQTGYHHHFKSTATDYFQHSAGIVIQFGGSDRDKDGIQDKEDACPDTPGLKEFNGCPDTDKDGIADKDDACPEVAGLKQFNGCPDTDKDGIADKDDACPEVAGLKQFNGCPDRDGDGIADKDDACPDVAGVKANKGCPEEKKEPKFDNEAQKALNDIAKAILFDTGRATIKSVSVPVLDEIVNFFNKYKDSRFTIEGHTDSQGNKVSNQKLSERRAAAVKDYLVSKGVEASRLEVRGYGQEKPIATNKTAEGRKLNRRTEINLIK